MSAIRFVARASLAAALACGCKGSSSDQGSARNEEGVPSAASATAANAAITASATASAAAVVHHEVYCHATASSCRCDVQADGHDYVLTCDSFNRCVCKMDGAPGKTFVTPECGVEQWRTCGYPERDMQQP
jgi:hypothetical protein